MMLVAGKRQEKSRVRGKPPKPARSSNTKELYLRVSNTAKYSSEYSKYLKVVFVVFYTKKFIVTNFK